MQKPEQETPKHDSCAGCGRVVQNGRSGCLAMEKTFHLGCFVCTTCRMSLAGHTYYNVAGSPFCEKDYYATLEKCAVCQKTITQKIIKSRGKEFHPECFACSECNICLDAVPFTVDSAKAIHCIPCFHKKYAPQCSRCTKPIIPEEEKEKSVRIVAMDKSFHVDCYCCEECGISLYSKAEGKGCYPINDKMLCKSCNVKRLKANVQ